MGRKASLKRSRRKERQLLEAHPHRQCGFVYHKTGARCERAGRWEVGTLEGQATYRADTREMTTTPGRVYSCDTHVFVFRAQGNEPRRIA